MRRYAIVILFAINLAIPLQSSAQEASASHLDRIKANKMMRVCIWPDYFSITYRNPKTQVLSGIDIDLATELGKDLGVTVHSLIVLSQN